MIPLSSTLTITASVTHNDSPLAGDLVTGTLLQAGATFATRLRDAGGGMYTAYVNLANSSLPAGPYSLTVTAVDRMYGTGQATEQIGLEKPLPSTPGDWPLNGATPARSGDNAFETVLRTTTFASVARMWAAPSAFAEGEVTSYGGIVFLGDTNGLRAVDPATGRDLWTYDGDPHGPYTGAPAISDGIVFAPAEWALTALDAGSGMPLWTYSIANAQPVVSVGPPVVSRGAVYDTILTGDGVGELAAWSEHTGALLWTRTVEQTGWLAAPALASDGTWLYVSCSAGQLSVQICAYDPTDGQSSATDIPFQGFASGFSLMVATGLVIASAFTTTLAVDPVAHSVLWVQQGLFARATDGSAIYGQCADGDYCAANSRTGALRWRTAPSQPGMGTVALAGGLEYVTTVPPPATETSTNTCAGLAVFDAATGALRWFQYTGGAYTTATISHGQVFVAGASVAAYGPPSVSVAPVVPVIPPPRLRAVAALPISVTVSHADVPLRGDDVWARLAPPAGPVVTATLSEFGVPGRYAGSLVLPSSRELAAGTYTVTVSAQDATFGMGAGDIYFTAAGG